MKLYHGTNVEFIEIDIKKSRPNKDFGKGFYLSADISQAQKMAEFKTLQTGGTPIILTFDFDESLFNSTELKIKKFEDYSIEWAKFVIANRNNPTGESVHDYDIVIGPIANDKIGVQLRKFSDNEIDIETFMNRLKYMKGITFQYFFGTEKAIKILVRNE